MPGMRHRPLVIAACLLALLPSFPAAQQAGKVLIGYCVGLKGLETAKAAGFDYVELGTTEIAALSDADFDAAVAAREAGRPFPRRTPTCSCRARSG